MFSSLCCTQITGDVGRAGLVDQRVDVGNDGVALVGVRHHVPRWTSITSRAVLGRSGSVVTMGSSLDRCRPR